MELKGEEVINAAKEKVWEALNDPNILKKCIAGCSEVVRTQENDFEMIMIAKIGPVKAKFKGQLKLDNLNPPDSYTITFNGTGGVAGFGKGKAAVNLIDKGEDTQLTYDATASVGGKLAQVGSRLIDGVAKKMATDFFEKFNKEISGKTSEPLLSPSEKIRDSNWIFWSFTITALTLLLVATIMGS